MDNIIAIIVELDVDESSPFFSNRYLWSGDNVLSFNSKNYIGNSTLTDASDFRIDSSYDNISISMAVDGRSIDEFNSLNNKRIYIEYIYSQDGETFIITGRSLNGRIASSSISNGVYSAEVEDTRRNNITGIIWSDSAQRERYNGDRCFEFAGELADGKRLVSWP